MADSAPTRLPEWATDPGADVVEPTALKKATGWQSGERPPGQYLNDWQLLVYQWIALFSAVYRGARTWWTENWHFATAQFTANGWTVVGAPSPVTTVTPIVSSGMSDRFVNVPGNASSTTSLAGVGIRYFDDETIVDLEFDLQITGYGTSTSYSFEAGWFFAGGATDRIVIQKTDASANFYLQVSTVGGSATDTTVPAVAGQVYRVRLEYIGNAGGDSTARLWIDGDMVAEIADSEVPVADTAGFSAVTDESMGGTLGSLYIGPLSVRAE